MGSSITNATEEDSLIIM